MQKVFFSQKKEAELFEILHKCLTNPAFTDISLQESSIRHLIVEEISDDDVNKIDEGLNAANEAIDAFEDMLATLAGDKGQAATKEFLPETIKYFAQIRKDILEGRKISRRLALTPDKIKTLWGEKVQVPMLVSSLISIQQEVIGVSNGIISTFLRIKKYGLDKLFKSVEGGKIKKVDIDKDKTITEVLKDFDPENVQDELGEMTSNFQGLFTKELNKQNKNKGVWEKIKGIFSRAAKEPPLSPGQKFLKATGYLAIPKEMTKFILEVPKVAELEKVAATLAPPPDNDLADVAQNVAEDLPEGGESSDSDKEKGKDKGGSERGDTESSSKGKLNDDNIASIKTIFSDLFGDDESNDNKKKFAEILRGAKLIEGKHRGLKSQEDDVLLERWQKFAGLK